MKAGVVEPSSLTISTVLGLLVPPMRNVPSSTVQLTCFTLGKRSWWVSCQVPLVRVRQVELVSSPPHTIRPDKVWLVLGRGREGRLQERSGWERE